ncbi:transmembrane protein, putative (macronuclear) [Tetrahymena thermophila SB210]|uniref:Transmembrane protein, putative n=1 Tax=Tetrahymena thermophila (strain SB210) TaxID=312017 RepID=Q22N24_TETTS|nr:transmembrane protein, putative [Tetrahymena thermophila SB210]EAR86652.2 transmembrane protein, putative [Tetrahymena thermophila SB210]|eukprot:XP_976846.2 transmembrane protein, putative [Tetrahymena thermophila SB210]
MKILSITIQNKKGQILFMVTSNNFSHEQGVRYSNSIYEYILSVSKQEKKVDKTIIIDSSIICICYIIQELIILVLVPTSQTQIGFEGAKKLSSYFKSNSKMEDLNKKYILINQMLEDFLYTRELNLSKVFQFKLQQGEKMHQIYSKQQADFEVFNSFLDMDNSKENKEMKSIANIPLRYWTQVQQNIQKVNLIVQQSKEISINVTAATDNANQTSVQSKYKKIIEQQRNLFYRYAFKLTTKVATQPKRPLTNYQQVSMIPKHQIKLDSISSHDIQGGYHRKNNSVTTQYMHYQKETIQNGNISQTPTSVATVDLLDMDFFSTSSKSQQQQIYNPQPQIQQNITHRPVQIPIQKQESNVLDLLDSEDEDETPTTSQAAPKINTNNQIYQNNNNNNNLINKPINQNGINNGQINTTPLPNLQAQPNRYSSIFGNKVTQQNPLPQNTLNQNVAQNQQRMSLPANNNNAAQPNITPKPPLQPNQQQSNLQKNDVSLKIQEKLQIIQKDNNFPQGFQLNGQITVQGDFKDDVVLIELKGKNWDPQITKHRGTPNTFPYRTNKENTAYQIKVDKSSLSQPKPVIDLLMNSQLILKAQQIPLFFLYQYETKQAQSINFRFQYMVNQKWNSSLFDVQFYIVLDDRLIFSDMQHNPFASSYQNKTLLWKTQKLNANSKGNLSLTLHGINLQPQEILKYIRLCMKSDSILADLDAQMTTLTPGRTIHQAQKQMLIEYKILPNSN